ARNRPKRRSTPRSRAAIRCCGSSSARSRANAAPRRPPHPMEKRSVFNHRLLPYLLLLAQVAITLVFFYWPASQAVWQSFLVQDAFGLSTTFVRFENYRDLFSQPEYYQTIATTLIFSAAVTALSLSCALLLAVQADKPLRAGTIYRTLLIWPYAVAPAVAG